jgi:hypothetical protein
LWPNIRFLTSTVTEKNATKNILDGRKDRGKTVYPPPPSGSGGIINFKQTKIWKYLLWDSLKTFVGSVFGPIRFLLPVCRFCWFLYTLNIYAHFSQQLLMTGIWYLVTSFI